MSFCKNENIRWIWIRYKSTEKIMPCIKKIWCYLFVLCKLLNESTDINCSENLLNKMWIHEKNLWNHLGLRYKFLLSIKKFLAQNHQHSWRYSAEWALVSSSIIFHSDINWAMSHQFEVSWCFVRYSPATLVVIFPSSTLIYFSRKKI